MAHESPVILIVEDEFLLRMDSAEMIENAGFEVVQAGDADEAICNPSSSPCDPRRLHRYPDAGLDGRSARFVRDRWPPIKIVATSGLVRAGAEDLPAGSVFLPKPYRGAQVVATLREMTRAA